MDHRELSTLIKHGTDFCLASYLVQMGAWIFCLWLLVYEYNKRLSEAWYAHQLFWLSNMFLEFLTMSIYHKKISAMDKTFMIIEIVANFVLIILMFKTKRRDFLNLRPI
jgi:hypothetical protein